MPSAKAAPRPAAAVDLSTFQGQIAAFAACLAESPQPWTGRTLYSGYVEFCWFNDLDPVDEAALFRALADLRGWKRYFNDPVIEALLRAGKWLDNRHLAASIRAEKICPRTGRKSFGPLSEGEVSKRRALDLKAWVYTAGRSGPGNKSVMIWVRPLKPDEQFPSARTLWTWPTSAVERRTIADVTEERLAA